MARDELNTPNEAADYWKVQIETVWRWCRQGTLPVVKIDKYWRVNKADLDRFIASQRGRSAAQGEEQHG